MALEGVSRIKWNEVTWYSRLGALIVLLGIIPAISFYVGAEYQRTIVVFQQESRIAGSKVSNTSGSPSVMNAAGIDTAPIKTYQNKDYGFQIDVPSDIIFSRQGADSGAVTPLDVSWYFPQSYLGTTTDNEVEIDVTVRSVSCSSDGYTGPIKKINGIDFHTRILGSGGDGGISGLDIPVTYFGADKNGLCYELEITSTNNGGMTIPEEQRMYSIWLSMIATFKFD